MGARVRADFGNRAGPRDVQISYLIIDNFYDDPYTVRNAAPHTTHCQFRIAKAGAEARATLRMHVDGANYW
jgi:hypothetical protein